MTNLELLHEQLESHKKSLNNVNDSIKKLNGSSKKISNENQPEAEKPNDAKINEITASENNSGGTRIIHLNSSVTLADSRQVTRKSNFYDNNSRENNDRKRKNFDDDRASKRHVIEAESGDDDDRTRKHSIQSSVVSSNMPIKSKEDLIKLQNKFNGSEQRNKRIFGVILGTLKQFKSDDKERSSTSQAIHRKELEEKIEVKKIEESKKISEEKRRLEEEKHIELKRIQIIEQKIKITEDFEFWKKCQIQLKKFIKTKEKPSIFYLPKILEPKTRSLLEESKQLIENEINKRSKEVEDELENLTKEINDTNKENLKGEEEDKNQESIQMKVEDTIEQAQQPELSDTEMNDGDIQIGDEVDSEEENDREQQQQQENENENDKKDENETKKEEIAVEEVKVES